MRTIPEVSEDIKSILNNIERTEECTGETLVDINELVDEILTVNCYKDKPKTNADRIRSMSDEELAEFITGLNEHCLAGIGKVDCSSLRGFCEDDCKMIVAKWLQSMEEE